MVEMIDITGQRFGKLTAIRPTEKRDAGGNVVWLCKCDCGNVRKYSSRKLRYHKREMCHICFILERNRKIKQSNWEPSYEPEKDELWESDYDVY